MQRITYRLGLGLFLLPILFVGTVAVAAAPDLPVVEQPVAPDPGCAAEMSLAPVTAGEPAAELLVAMPGALEATPAAGETKCCDPALEPGTNGNPLCFEGHTCCASGQWQCNNADGTPSCTGGEVCGSTCGLSGASCNAGADCCSGQCKGNHKCR